MILRYVLAAGIRRSPVKFPSLIPFLNIFVAGSIISLQRNEFTLEMNYIAYNQKLNENANEEYQATWKILYDILLYIEIARNKFHFKLIVIKAKNNAILHDTTTLWLAII